MDLGIAGRTALCAGASTGLGYATARALAHEGVRVHLSARNAERLDESVRRLRVETGAVVEGIVADHSTAEGRQRLVEQCPAPDILVTSCTPPPIVGTFEDITEADWAATMNVAFVGPVELMRLLVPGMVARRFGRVVNIGTVGAKQPHEVRLTSGASRAALCNYTAAVSKSVAQHNVAINNALPGMFQTEGLRALEDPAAPRTTGPNGLLASIVGGLEIPADRYGEPDEFGRLCAVLCSDAAGYLVGESISIDGGLVRSMF